MEFVCDCNRVHTDEVEAAKAAMLPPGEVLGLSALFKLLGDPTRLRILWALDGRELCVCDLSAALAMTKSAVSHQLNGLRTAKLVKFRREGKNVYYSLDDDHVNRLLKVAKVHLSEQ